MVNIVLVSVVVAVSGGDPLKLVRIGTRFSQGDPTGTEGYDGQFIYFIALDPNPVSVAPLLDVPAYRYQRILMPLLARLVSMGTPSAIPWILPVLGIIALVCGTWAVSVLLDGWGVSRWYALVYGLWAGFTLALIVDLPEPLAYGLVAGGILAIDRDRLILGWVLMGLSVFAKEVTILFVAAAILGYASQRRWREACLLGLIALMPFLLFQLWLCTVFGEPGIGSGGAMATPFELIPFMGFLRIGASSMVYLLAMAVVFVPAVILPAVWGIFKSVCWIRDSELDMIVFALLVNSLVIVFTPFSTFRETGGIIRFASGLMLAVLLFAGRFQQRRVLNYSIFWLVLNVFLIKS